VREWGRLKAHNQAIGTNDEMMGATTEQVGKHDLPGDVKQEGHDNHGIKNNAFQ
jgi:hypothetical protein